MRERIKEYELIERIGREQGITKETLASEPALYIPYDGSQLYPFYKPEDFRRIRVAPNTPEEAERQAKEGRLAFHYVTTDGLQAYIHDIYTEEGKKPETTIAPTGLIRFLGLPQEDDYKEDDYSLRQAALFETASTFSLKQAIENRSKDTKAIMSRTNAIGLIFGNALAKREITLDEIALLGIFAYYFTPSVKKDYKTFLARGRKIIKEAIEAHGARRAKAKEDIEAEGITEKMIKDKMPEIILKAIKEKDPAAIRATNLIGKREYSRDAAERLEAFLLESKALDTEGLEAVYKRITTGQELPKGEKKEIAKAQSVEINPYWHRQPSQTLAVQIERMSFAGFALARDEKERERVEAYQKAKRELPEREEALDSRIKEAKGKLEALDPFADDAEREALEAELKGLEDEKANLENELWKLSEDIAPGLDGQAYINKSPRFYMPTHIGRDGKIEKIYDIGEGYLRLSVPPETAIAESDSNRIKTDLLNVIKHWLFQKCFEAGGNPEIWISWKEAYSMIGGIVDKNGEKEGRKMFSRALEILQDTRIQLKAKKNGGAKSFYFVAKVDTTKGGGVLIKIEDELAAAIANDRRYIKEAEAAKLLPNPTDMTAYYNLNYRENLKADNHIWTLKELAGALVIPFDPRHPERARKAIEKKIAAFKQVGLVKEDGFRETEERGKYYLITAHGETEAEERARKRAATRLANALGVPLLEARQALERNDWDEAAATEDIKAKTKGKAIRRKKAKAKAKADNEDS